MTKIKKYMSVFIMALILDSFLTACSILKKPEPEKQYFLTVLAPQSSNLSPNLPIMVVDRPTANAPFNTNKILVIQPFQEIVPLPGVSWSEAIPQMVQQLLVEHFQTGKLVVPLSRENGGLRAAYVLQTEVRDFQVADWQGKPTVTVTLQANYIDLESRKLIFSRIFKQQIPIANNDVTTVIQGFQQAVTLMFKDISAAVQQSQGRKLLVAE